MHPTSNGHDAPVTVFVATVSRITGMRPEAPRTRPVTVVTSMTLMSEDPDHVAALADVAAIDGWTLDGVEEVTATIDAQGVATIIVEQIV
jgi:hypothetical protein